MISLTQAIQSKWAADAALATAFPGGFWADAAPEGTAMPYVVHALPSAPATCCYGTARHITAQIRLSVYGIGRDAMLGLAELLAGQFRDGIVTLASGQNYDARQLSDPMPQRAGRDASSADDAGLGDVWAVHFTIEYAIRGN